MGKIVRVQEGRRIAIPEMAPRCFTYWQLVEATNNYSDEIDCTQFKGKVYEYMSQGSLAHLIFASGLEMQKPDATPSWKKRVGMAMDVAKGILYLHEGFGSTVIHGDINPDNVLVAEDGTAKIGNLRQATLLASGQSEVCVWPPQERSHSGRQMYKAQMYRAPEWTSRDEASKHEQMPSNPITSKVDVFSYGVLLLELLTCKDYLGRHAGDDGVYISSTWVYKCLMESTLECLLPYYYEEEEVDKEELKKMVMVALWCIQKDPANRRSMKQVVRMLEGLESIPPPPPDFV